MKPFARLAVGTFKASLVALSLSACASHPLDGNWTQPNGTTELPPELGGGLLDVDAQLFLDDVASPKTFDLEIALAFEESLSDSFEALGTYVTTDKDLTFTFVEFVVDPSSGNTSAVAEDGSQCITLQGFGGAAVCFPSPQTHPYTLSGDKLTITLDNAIGGYALSQTHLVLDRVK